MTAFKEYLIMLPVYPSQESIELHEAAGGYQKLSKQDETNVIVADLRRRNKWPYNNGDTSENTVAS